MASESAKQKPVVKFGNAAGASLDTVKKAPEETQQQFHSVSSKGDFPETGRRGSAQL